MAVTRVGEIFNYLVFGNVDSRDYDVYITGEAVFDAPTRAVEAVTVPGRNGDILIDQGHWNNLEVTYKCGIATDDKRSFAAAVNAFRNAVASQLGYVRLEDSYNPNEYRLGVFQSGIDVSTVSQNRSGEFTVTFFCKPQRFLKSGETAITVTDGQTLNNPTLYPSSPLIEASGYGVISFNNFNIDATAINYGDVEVKSPWTDSAPDASYMKTVIFSFDSELGNGGDLITIDEMSIIHDYQSPIIFLYDTVVGSRFDYEHDIQGTSGIAKMTNIVFTLGLAESKTYQAIFKSVLYESLVSIGIQLEYDGTAQFKLWILYQSFLRPFVFSSSAFVLHSSKMITENPIYIDTEIGEAYQILNDEYVDLNQYVAIGSDLPTLAPGDNEITYSDTFTAVTITPRWWEL